MKKPVSPSKRSAPAVASAEEVQDHIRRRAYELWEQAGREPGHNTEHGLQAEREAHHHQEP